MKKGLIIVIGLIFLVIISANIMAADVTYKNGHYIGYAANDHGDAVIELIIEGGQIVDVNMLNPFKLDYQYEPAKELFLEWPALVIKNQSADIDTISGATNSSGDYKKATRMALDIASGNYEGDKYYGVAKNYEHGHTVVVITVEGSKITDAGFITANPDLLGSEDGREKLMPAKGDDYGAEVPLKYYKEFPAEVVANQGNVNTISGATHSGESYNAALDMAMEQAGLK